MMQGGNGDPSVNPDEGLRLLLCDDSADQRTSLSYLLTNQGYALDQAADGVSAIRLLKARAYSLLLLDLQMPGMDGFDVLAYIQKHLPDLPVVLLSGLPPEEIGDGIFRLPNPELPPLLLKPIDTAQLFQIIELKLAGELP